MTQLSKIKPDSYLEELKQMVIDINQSARTDAERELLDQLRDRLALRGKQIAVLVTIDAGVPVYHPSVQKVLGESLTKYLSR
jgi:uncharacterized membrane protein YgcG